MPQVPDISVVLHNFNRDFQRWLVCRGEFELAEIIGTCTTKTDISEIRRFIISSIVAHRNKMNAHTIVQFKPSQFDPETTHFTRIGSGSLGGKGRGLGFMHMTLEEAGLRAQFPGVRVRVPWTLAISTSVFDDFMEKSQLYDFALNLQLGSSDTMITEAFLSAKLPVGLMNDISRFCEAVKDVPLAVRSSSLFEDTFRQPFAGIYKTYFLPNQSPSLDFRINEVCQAIKLVYASTFWTEAKNYMRSTSFRTEEMKMAVLIQEIAGSRHDKWIYPSLSGVARAHNFYPQQGARASDGIALLALGLGGTVVDGGACVRIPANSDYGPTYSGKLQDTFMALDVTLPFREEKSLVDVNVDLAHEHGTLSPVGGFIDINGEVVHMPYKSPRDQLSQSGTVTNAERLGGQDVHGLRREFSKHSPVASTPEQPDLVANGLKKVVTMDGVLNCRDLDLRSLLTTLLKIGSHGFECPVEIEFAVNLAEDPNEPHDFVLLQTRPMSMWRSNVYQGFSTLPSPDVSIIATKRALGNGGIEGVHDIVFIDLDNFEPSRAAELVPTIAALNQEFNAREAKYLLVCPGRVGTKQPAMGIPVQWSDINATRCIVETDIQGTDVPPSEGTHFFQNLVSFGIAYFTVYQSDEGHVNFHWLKHLLPHEERQSKDVVRTLHFEQPLEIVIDGMTSCGVVMKPEHDFSTIVSQQSAFESIMNSQHSRL